MIRTGTARKPVKGSEPPELVAATCWTACVSTAGAGSWQFSPLAPELAPEPEPEPEVQVPLSPCAASTTWLLLLGLFFSGPYWAVLALPVLEKPETARVAPVPLMKTPSASTATRATRDFMKFPF